MVRKFNFNPGPATLPLSVLEKVQAEFLDFKNAGMSIVEISHRSKEFEALLEHAKATLKEIMGIPDTHDTIFVGGGASLQFAMIPMNFLGENECADYVNTGEWSQRAIKEARAFGKVNLAACSEADKFSYIPNQFNFSPEARYLHITSNNTIFGTQWPSFPEAGQVPMFVDMSSDFLSRRLDVNKFSLIYAGAQKNAGPAGVTIIILRKDMLGRVVSRKIPTMLQYKTHLENNSLYNTPPVFAIYMCSLVFDWIKEIGGLEKVEEINEKKARLLYDTIDGMPEYYKGTVQKESRSRMNVTFRLPSEELEKKFVSEASKLNLHGLKGHRSVGGIRVSMYNALPLEGIEKLTAFMKEFAATNK